MCGRSTRSLERTKVLRDAPHQVRNAVRLLWASLFIGTAFAIVEWEPFPPELESYRGEMWLILAFSVIVPALLIWFISRRHNWARILTILLTIGGIALSLWWANEMPAEPWWSVAVTVIVTGMDLIAIYWLFSGSGAQWFAQRA